MTDLINTVLGDYKVEAFIGEGPNGRVFRAAGLTLRVPVALKVFDSRFTSDPEIKARLLMYGQEVGALSHAHIATVHHTHSSSTHTFVVSELVDGPNLAQFRPSTAAREWVPSWWGVVNCVRQAAEAVAAAHEAGVAHGNLKLTDVLLSGPDPATAAVKVTDFGLDRLLAGTEPDAEAERRKDVHSLGRMLYELTTGRTMPDEPPSSMTEGATLPREIVAGLADNDANGRLEVFDAAGDIRIAGGTAGFAVVLMVHGPAIEPVVGEGIHHRPVALARHLQIEYPRGHRRAVHEEQHRPRRLARLRRAQPLAVHPQRDVALLRPVFVAPDLRAVHRSGDSIRRG